MMPVVCALVVFLFGGCVQMQMLPHLDQALVLRSMDEEKDAQDKYVHDTDAQFEQLLAAVQSGDIKKYKTHKDIVSAFGPPVVTNNIAADGMEFKQCLYRYAIQSKSPKRIYLYFNAQERLIRWESL